MSAYRSLDLPSKVPSAPAHARSETPTSRRQFLVRGTSAAVGLAAFLAGCGSDGTQQQPRATSPTGGAAGNLDEVRAALEAVRQIPAFAPPGPPVDASAAAGKTVFYLPIAMAIPVVQNWWAGLEVGASAAGLNAVNFDPQGQLAEVNRGINQAISQKADVLVLDAVQSQTVTEPLKRATDAGIKLIVSNEGGEAVSFATAEVSQDLNGAAVVEADWIIADAAGKEANVVILSQPGFPSNDAMVTTINDRFAKYCPDTCITLQVEEIAVPDWQTRLPVITRSNLTRFPELNYFIPLFDGMALSMVPAIRDAGALDRVKISTFNASPDVMQLMAKGEVVTADVGAPNVWAGWAYADQALRVLTDMDPVDERIPLRLFDSENLASIDLSAPEGDWYNTSAAIDGYKELWGVS